MIISTISIYRNFLYQYPKQECYAKGNIYVMHGLKDESKTKKKSKSEKVCKRFAIIFQCFVLLLRTILIIFLPFYDTSEKSVHNKPN